MHTVYVFGCCVFNNCEKITREEHYIFLNNTYNKNTKTSLLSHKRKINITKRHNQEISQFIKTAKYCLKILITNLDQKIKTGKNQNWKTPKLSKNKIDTKSCVL